MGIETRKTFLNIPVTPWKRLPVAEAVNYTPERIIDAIAIPAAAPAIMVTPERGRAIPTPDDTLEIHSFSRKTGEWHLDLTIPTEVLASGFTPEKKGFLNRTVRPIFREQHSK